MIRFVAVNRPFQLLLYGLLLFAIACGGDANNSNDTGPVDVEPELPPPAQTCAEKAGSCYSLEIVLPSGLVQTFERDLDDRPWVISFGSAHIGPAVSLAVEDTWEKPYTVVTFNLGFVVGSNDHDITIHETGVWPWGSGEVNAPPGFKIYLKDNGKPRELASWLDGASGEYLIKKWGTEVGQVIEGNLQGTLVDKNSVGKETGIETGTVTGLFRLILPEKSQ